jgi:hypothetical protein
LGGKFSIKPQITIRKPNRYIGFIRNPLILVFITAQAFLLLILSYKDINWMNAIPEIILLLSVCFFVSCSAIGLDTNKMDPFQQADFSRDLQSNDGFQSFVDIEINLQNSTVNVTVIGINLANIFTNSYNTVAMNHLDPLNRTVRSTEFIDYTLARRYLQGHRELGKLISRYKVDVRCRGCPSGTKIFVSTNIASISIEWTVHELISKDFSPIYRGMMAQDVHLS